MASTDRDAQPSIIAVAVLQLISFVHRTGGLGRLSFSSFSGTEGTRLHQLFYRRFEELMPGHRGEPERTLRLDLPAGELTLRVQGRADLLVQGPGEAQAWPLEIKSTASPLADLPEEGDPLHWAQARSYAYMLQRQAEAQDGAARPELLRYGLAYISSLDHQVRLMTREEPIEALEAWFDATCRAYLDFARNQRIYAERRDRSIRALRFPYPSLRPGQRVFMRRVVQQLRSRGALLIEAPTGLGKTMSTLYPAIKALAAGLHRQIFYLTARSSTGDVAHSAMQALWDAGLVLRAVQLTAKEKLCVMPELFCDTLLCPYARDYYRNSREAIHEGLAELSIGEALLLRLARKHRVCPFELQLDLALSCDLIIGDYNYAFDPRVRLERFFADQVFHHALLVDEAHNLPDRAREMYSQTFSLAELRALRQQLAEAMPRAAQVCDPLLRYLEAAERDVIAGEGGEAAGAGEADAQSVSDDDGGGDGAGLLAEEAGLKPWRTLEPRVAELRQMRAERFLGLREQPRFNGLLGHFVVRLRDVLDELDDLALRRQASTSSSPPSSTCGSWTASGPTATS